MPARLTARPAAVTAIAAIAGILAVAYALPWATLTGTGGLFAYPTGDLPTNLVGHLAFQAPGWHWPLLRAPLLAWPHGESIAMTDSNPALSLLAKPLASLLGHPVNLFGAWLALCLLAQPLAALYALRGLQRAPAPAPIQAAAALAAAMLALLLPAYLFRVFHINLMGQFLLLGVLGVAARGCARQRAPGFATAAGLLTLIILVHPYLFIFSAITLAAPPMHLLLRRAPAAREAWRGLGLAALLPAVLFLLLSGAAGGGGPGFGLYSMNLLGPFWPQLSFLFGPANPILDATGFQHEGFNYLGAGILLLLACAALQLVRAGRAGVHATWQRFGGLIVILLGLTALAITPRLTFGHATLVPFSAPPVERLFAAVRASGRAIWVVDYALILGAIALLAASLRPRLFVPLIALVLALQWLDTAPLRQRALSYLAGEGQTPPPFTLPPGTTLFRAVPLCTPEDVTADTYRLAALRAGAALAEARLAHPPLPAACAAARLLGMTTPLAKGETRLFLPSVQADVAPARLAATCTPTPAGLLCH